MTNEQLLEGVGKVISKNYWDEAGTLQDAAQAVIDHWQVEGRDDATTHFKPTLWAHLPKPNNKGGGE